MGNVRHAVLALMLCGSIANMAYAQMKVESLAGPVTKAETESFLQYVSSLSPDPDNQNNRWSYGPSGQAVKAIGMVYEINVVTAFVSSST